MERLSREFYRQNAVVLAEKLLGKTIVRVWDNGTEMRYRIIETEAYMGEDDLACHASKGCTPRTKIMYGEGGYLYVYLIYGIYWMLNVVAGEKNHPEAVLIRGIDNVIGSGRAARELGIDKSFYGEDLTTSQRIWIEDAPDIRSFRTAPRVGIEYAGEIWKNIAWRFIMDR